MAIDHNRGETIKMIKLKNEAYAANKAAKEADIKAQNCQKKAEDTEKKVNRIERKLQSIDKEYSALHREVEDAKMRACNAEKKAEQVAIKIKETKRKLNKWKPSCNQLLGIEICVLLFVNIAIVIIGYYNENRPTNSEVVNPI